MAEQFDYVEEPCGQCRGSGKVYVKRPKKANDLVMISGSVKNIRDRAGQDTRAKGFIFVVGDDGVSRFCHKSQVSKSINFEALEEGDRVTFRHVDGEKGPRAENLQLAAVMEA